ncbi:UNKNOWN [Stylonychia lemnae]|uniref:Uncharacterized protein n=1 Tax=Stylonychia lemnae TaxID=5949 RepID=A0A078B4N6_STYLE|nr:UNKNOWN [Stylonychia lemnae]|eukprot:CDW89384.1 UNKNOWN [Stylonychia lemnae]
MEIDCPNGIQFNENIHNGEIIQVILSDDTNDDNILTNLQNFFIRKQQQCYDTDKKQSDGSNEIQIFSALYNYTILKLELMVQQKIQPYCSFYDSLDQCSKQQDEEIQFHQWNAQLYNTSPVTQVNNLASDQNTSNSAYNTNPKEAEYIKNMGFTNAQTISKLQLGQCDLPYLLDKYDFELLLDLAQQAYKLRYSYQLALPAEISISYYYQFYKISLKDTFSSKEAFQQWTKYERQQLQTYELNHVLNLNQFIDNQRKYYYDGNLDLWNFKIKVQNEFPLNHENQNPWKLSQLEASQVFWFCDRQFLQKKSFIPLNCFNNIISYASKATSKLSFDSIFSIQSDELKQQVDSYLKNNQTDLKIKFDTQFANCKLAEQAYAARVNKKDAISYIQTYLSNEGCVADQSQLQSLFIELEYESKNLYDFLTDKLLKRANLLKDLCVDDLKATGAYLDSNKDQIQESKICKCPFDVQNYIHNTVNSIKSLDYQAKDYILKEEILNFLQRCDYSSMIIWQELNDFKKIKQEKLRTNKAYPFCYKDYDCNIPIAGVPQDSELLYAHKINGKYQVLIDYFVQDIEDSCGVDYVDQEQLLKKIVSLAHETRSIDIFSDSIVQLFDLLKREILDQCLNQKSTYLSKLYTKA